MGADLYIRKVNEPLYKKYEKLLDKWVEKRNSATDDTDRKKAQKKVSYYYDKMYSEGYFRDSYNSTSLLWQYDLSWWQDIKTNDQGELTPEKANELLFELDARKDVFNRNMQSIVDNTNDKMTHCSDYDTKEGREGWVKYFVEKDQRFREFLKSAIDLNEPIDCSL